MFLSDHLSQTRSRLKHDDYNKALCDRPRSCVRGPEFRESGAEPWLFVLLRVEVSARKPAPCGRRTSGRASVARSLGSVPPSDRFLSPPRLFSLPSCSTATWSAESPCSSPSSPCTWAPSCAVPPCAWATTGTSTTSSPTGAGRSWGYVRRTRRQPSVHSGGIKFSPLRGMRSQCNEHVL